jgi:hypothetical protein
VGGAQSGGVSDRLRGTGAKSASKSYWSQIGPTNLVFRLGPDRTKLASAERTQEIWYISPNWRQITQEIQIGANGA